MREEDFSSEEMEGGEAKLFLCLFGTRWRRPPSSPLFHFAPPNQLFKGENTRRATLLRLRLRRSGANEKEKKARWCFLRISVALSQQKKEERGGKGFFRFFVFLLSVSGRA